MMRRNEIIQVLVPVFIIDHDDKKVWSGIGSFTLPHTKVTVLTYHDTNDPKDTVLGSPMYSALYHN